MQRLKYFSGIKPTLEDLEFDQAGKENAILDRQREMFSDGVVSGFELVDTGGAYTLLPGVAYIDGERVAVQVGIDIPVNSSQLPLFLFLKHDLVESHPTQHFITGEEHQIYQADGYSTVLKSTPQAAEGELLLAEITGEGVIDRRTFVRLAVDERMHVPNTDIGTTNSEFRIRIGDPQHPEGLRVLTESPVPKPPLNLRITSIKPERSTLPSLDGIPALSNLTYRSSGLARVAFGWNYLDVVGEAVGTNTFRIENPYQFAADALEGYFLKFADNSEFLIEGNQPTSGGTTIVTAIGDILGRSAREQPASIYPGVSEYRFTAWPVQVGPQTPRITDPSANPTPLALLPVASTDRIEGVIAGNDFSLLLPLGTFWALQLQSVRGGMVSAPRLMAAGSYLKNGQPVVYSYPFLIGLPNIGNATLNLSQLPEGKGFTATIVGWDEADALEYGWIRSQGAEGESIDFNNPAHRIGMSTGRTITVALLEDYIEIVARPSYSSWMLNLGQGGVIQPPQPVSKSYLFAVRPLMSGQVVGAVVSARITITIEPDWGQTAVASAIGTMARHIDALNKQVRNLDAVRQAQAGMIEDQLVTLNSQLVEGQQYSRFNLLANVNLPFQGMAEIPLLAGAQGGSAGKMTFILNPTPLEQAFTHDLGHTNYVVQVRDEEGNLVTADVTLELNRVVVRLAESMTGSVILFY